jgi:hypothetical protein
MSKKKKPWGAIGVQGWSLGKKALMLLLTLLVAIGGMPGLSMPGEGSVFAAPATTWQLLGQEGIAPGQVRSLNLKIANGTTYFAYHDEHNGGKATVKKYNENSSRWETVGTEGFTPNSATSVSLSVYGSVYNNVYSNVPYVAYAYSGFGKASVKKYNGDSWETVGSVDISSEEVSSVKVYAEDGTPYVVYTELRGLDDAVMVKKFNGIDWEIVGPGDVDFIGDNGFFSSPSLHVYRGTPYIAYAKSEGSSPLHM